MLTYFLPVYAYIAEHPPTLFFFFFVTLQVNHTPLGIFRLDDREEQENKTRQGGADTCSKLARQEYRPVRAFEILLAIFFSILDPKIKHNT